MKTSKNRQDSLEELSDENVDGENETSQIDIFKLYEMAQRNKDDDDDANDDEAMKEIRK